MTVSSVARESQLTRATARRLLLTLEELGYASQNAGQFTLTSRVLELGYSYLSSLKLPDLATPFLETLSESVNEASSVGVLDGSEIVYVARVPARRIVAVSIGLGTRFPAYRTSLGQAILASLGDDMVAEIWGKSDRTGETEHSAQSLKSLLEVLRQVRERGYALTDQELELGLRSIAAPIKNGRDQVVAAINISTRRSETSIGDLRERFIPRLLDTAEQLSAAIKTSNQSI